MTEERKMPKHPHHNDLVAIAERAWLSVAPISSSIIEECDNNDWPAPSNAELCQILTELHDHINS